jgi:hypothetical protein
MLKVVRNGVAGQADELALSLDELAREGARRMLAAALEAEASEYVERFRGQRDGEGHALLVRNGKARHRQCRLRRRPCGGSVRQRPAGPRFQSVQACWRRVPAC